MTRHNAHEFGTLLATITTKPTPAARSMEPAREFECRRIQRVVFIIPPEVRPFPAYPPAAPSLGPPQTANLLFPNNDPQPIPLLFLGVFANATRTSTHTLSALCGLASSTRRARPLGADVAAWVVILAHTGLDTVTDTVGSAPKWRAYIL